MAYPLLFYPFTLFRGSPEGLAPLVAAKIENVFHGVVGGYNRRGRLMGVRNLGCRKGVSDAER
jgi:hypothetical protein